jgi:hypothetical protein
VDSASDLQAWANSVWWRSGSSGDNEEWLYVSSGLPSVLSYPVSVTPDSTNVAFIGSNGKIAND